MTPVDVFGTEERGNARESLAHVIGADPFERLEELEEAGRRKAKAEALAWQMERERKHLLALYASEYAEVHAKENMSEAKLERLARADARYQKHLEGTAAAIEEREHAKSFYWKLRAELEWLEKTASHAHTVARLQQPG